MKILDTIKQKAIVWVLKGLDRDTWRRRLTIRLAANQIVKIMEDNNMSASWKTTLGGILAAIGTGLQAVKDPSWVALIGQILGGIGVLVIGAAARDNGVTSEQSGAKKD